MEYAMTYDELIRNISVNPDPQQEAAIQTVDGPVLLLAVPGSGKTTVLVTRLGYMVLCRGVAPESILTMTYTVAATADMRQRFSALYSFLASVWPFKGLSVSLPRNCFPGQNRK